ncbi:MAG TPA: outer membrane beta-barrel protein [Longimicrobiales bacterium]
MQHRLAIAVLAFLLLDSATAQAQRPKFGFGIGAGAVLGSQLVEHELDIDLDGQTLSASREVNLEDVAVLSANAEWYVISHVALRLHGAWGAGRLQIVTDREVDGEESAAEFESDFGDVQVTALDAGVSLWPWAPGTVGFAPFITFGIGSFAYDFDADTDDGLFHADGRRSERAWLLGIGADLHVWRSITLRVEAIDHIVDSPLEASDFDAAVGPVAARDSGDTVNNVRLTIGAHVYLPFRSYSLPSGP